MLRRSAGSKRACESWSEVAETFEVLWSETAIADLEGILRYAAANWNATAACDLHVKLRRKIRSLSRHPRRCRVVPELQDLGVMDFREMVLPPHRVIFRLYGRDLVLVGVLDSRRDLEELLLARALAWE